MAKAVVNKEKEGETPVAIPKMHEIEWTPYVIGLLDSKKECFGGRPKCDGLRRIFGLVMGDIVSSTTKVVQPANENNCHRCTVEHTLMFIKNNDGMGRIRTVTDAVDISSVNTSHPFNKYPTASAVTIAEGRALKKALCLVGVQTAEEMTTPPPTEDEEVPSSMKPVQKNVITKSASDQGIDLGKLLLHMKNDGVISSTDSSSMSYSEAQNVITQLSRYSDGPDAGGDVVPESILVA